MHARLFVTVLALAATLAAAAAQPVAKTARAVPVAPRATANFPEDTISIVTQGLPQGRGSDAERIAQLAQVYAAAGLPRLLPVAGLGPIANARDLLHMRGIDFAVLNDDIAAFAQLDGTLPYAGQRLTPVLKLSDKTIYIVVPALVKSINDLAGQRVLALGEDSDARVSARTIFGLLKLGVDLRSSDGPDAAAALLDGTAKALVMVAGDGDRPLAGLPQDKGLHLLAFPDSAALAKVYGRIGLAAKDFGSLVPPEGIRTLRVATLLVTFNWRPNFYRYAPVQRFIRTLPQAVAGLRASGTSPSWSEVNALAPAPIWPNFDPGAPLPVPAVTPPPVPLLPQAAAPALPPAIRQPPAAQPALATAPPKPFAAGVTVVATPMPGLLDKDAPGGGLLAEILVASLPRETVRQEWASDPASAASAIDHGKGARLALGWRRPNCNDAGSLTAGDLDLCARFAFSDPVFAAIDVFFVRHGSDFMFSRDEQVSGHSICAATDTDVSSLDAPGRRWLAQEAITLVRRPTLGECFAALDRGAIEAVFADELAGQAELERAGLPSSIEVVDRPVAVREISAIVAKTDADAAELLKRVGAGLNALKADGSYSKLVMSRLRAPMSATAEQAVK